MILRFHHFNYGFFQCTICLVVSGVIIIQFADSSVTKDVLTAPRFEKQAGSEIIVRRMEKLTLPCLASGQPKPLYHWLKDGWPLADNSSEDGNLILDTSSREVSGTYQCFATNSFGSASSLKSLVRFAYQDSFPRVKNPEIHRPQVGTPLVLYCHPPSGLPIGAIYWGKDKTNSKLTPFDNSARISLDFNGNLYFAHVLAEDYLKSTHYVCVVSNSYLRIIVQGDDRIIMPTNITGGRIPLLPPKIAWNSAVADVAVVGEKKRLKCIFSGYPTPVVTWRRVDQALQPRAVMESFGQELIISHIEIEDEGEYECRASASAAVSIKLSVQAPPKWIEDSWLEDVVVAEEDSAQFECKADGRPAPLIQWYINGVSINELPPDKRRIVGKDFLRFENVSKTNTHVVQCNASNQHGYIFSNAFLNVKADPPTFISTPPRVLIVAEGRNVTLPCQVMGAPKPSIIWRFGASGDLVVGPRFRMDAFGSLHISTLHLQDDGLYRCIASNKFGLDEAQGNLIVRKRVVIDDRDTMKMANVTDAVSLRCDVTTDSRDAEELSIAWFKDNVAIVNDDNYRMHHDGTLHVSKVQLNDSAFFKCNASTSYDSTVKIIQLIIKGPPDAPHDVHVTNCAQSYADVSWEHTRDNNDPVQQFVVFHNTSFDLPGFYHQAVVVHKDRLHVRVRLEPHAQYSFHVRARNSMGLSEMSNLSPGLCISPSSKPGRNPRHVCSESRRADTLTIVWETMPISEHYGASFFYLISYRSLDTDIRIQHKESNWKISSLSVPAETFKKFEVTVQAGNDDGMATLLPTDYRYVYSGQDAPLDSPSDFEVGDLTANSATFTWKTVDESFARIRGFFKGYRLRVWKVTNESLDQTHDVIIRPWDACPAVALRPNRRQRRSLKTHYFPKKSNNMYNISCDAHHLHLNSEIDIASEKLDSLNQPSGIVRHYTKLIRRKNNEERKRIRRRRQIGQELVEWKVNDLWPFSSIGAVVSVINGGHLTGPNSFPIFFETPEGVSEKVLDLTVFERGSNHLRIGWKEPLIKNGILLGYDIQFRKAPPYIDTAKWIHVGYEQLWKNVRGLEPATAYLIYVHAVNAAGRGNASFIEDQTLPANIVSRPSIISIDTGEDWANLTWTSIQSASISIDDDALMTTSALNETADGSEEVTTMYNPGDAFRIMYRQLDSDKMEISYFEHENMWLLLTNLTPAVTYEAEVLSYNDVSNVASKSQPKQFTLFQKGYLLTKLTSLKIWPLLLLLVLVLLLVLFVICCCICKMNRGKHYNVYKSEFLYGSDSINQLKENAFGEFLPIPKVSVRYSYSSQAKASVGSVSHSGSESDSLQEYDDPLLSRFNEDGSFIGLYKPKHTSNAWDVPSTKSSTA